MMDEIFNTDRQANRFAARVMILTVLFLVLIYILTVFGVFVTPLGAMTIATVIAAVVLSIPAYIVLVQKREGEWIKYLMVTAAGLMVSTVGVFLAHNIVLLYLYPIAIASLYFSKRLSRYAIILSLVLTSLCQIVGPYIGGIIDRNTFGLTQSMYGTVMFGVIPRCIQLGMLAYIFQELAKNTRRMLDNISEAQRQKDLKMAQSQRYIDEIIDTLNHMADGDMRVKLKENYSGEFAPVRDAFEHIAASLNDTLVHINNIAEQVSYSSAQVADGAQALAEGSTGQMHSVENLNVSVERIADQAEESLVIVGDASKAVQRANESLEAGTVHMEQLSRAMEEIGNASRSIEDITKAIESIASKTKILALNASIEAARAGDAGKGFAVVADEVSSLAAQSTESVKHAAELIQSSVDSVSKGIQITEETVRNLKDIRESAQGIMNGFGRIEQSSAAQSRAIEEIKQGLSQVSAVVQMNAATSEENSASSEEMSAYAAALHDEVGKFQLNTGRIG